MKLRIRGFDDSLQDNECDTARSAQFSQTLQLTIITLKRFARRRERGRTQDVYAHKGICSDEDHSILAHV